jgi:hypothetical protein
MALFKEKDLKIVYEPAEKYGSKTCAESYQNRKE